LTPAIASLTFPWSARARYESSSAAADISVLPDRYARSGKTLMSAAAELDSYRALADQGKVNEAIAGVKRAIETSSTAVPKDALMAELGDLYERSGSPADAKAIYQRLVSEYPESSYTSQAQSRIGGL